jgi:enoyl-CoA hydratase/carnithine racemase
MELERNDQHPIQQTDGAASAEHTLPAGAQSMLPAMADIQLIHRDNVRRIVINRPPLNLVDGPMLLALAAALASAAQHPHVRLVALMGAGEDAFCAGWDPQQPPEQREALSGAVVEVIRAFRALAARRIPTVAILKGQALGIGGELALLCDTLIAREDAVLALPLMDQDTAPPVAAMILPRLIGPRRALHLLLTGERRDARAAYGIGLVHQVLPAASFDQEVEGLLELLAACGVQT